MFNTKIHIHSGNFTKKLFFNILISFMVLVFLLVASFFLIFSNIYTSTVFKNISSDSMGSLERFDMEFDSIFSQIKQMNIAISQNSNINDFLYASDYDYKIMNRADTYLSQIKSLSPYLHSIILYNKKLNFQIVSGKLNVDISQFAAKKLTQPKSKGNLNMIFSKTGPDFAGEKNDTETISVIFSDSFDINEPLGYAIIMTLDREEIEKKLLNRFEGSTLVTDNTGKIIFHSGSTGDADSLPDQSIIKKVIQNKDRKGSFTARLTKDKKIIFFIKSTETDFYIINIRSLQNITNDIGTKRNILITISIIILVIFCAAVYIFTSKIYSPIKKVTEIFSNSKYKSTSGKMGEVDVIAGVFNEALGQLHQLEIKNVSYNQRLKEDYLRLVLKKGPVSDFAENETVDYGLRIEFSNLFVISVRIDNFNRLSDGEGLAYQTTLLRTMPEILDDIFDCEAVNISDGEIALLLNFKNTSNNNFDLLLSEMEKLRELSSETLQITITIGIGGIANSEEECVKAYNTALEMTKYRFTLGFNKTIYSKYLNEYLASNIYYPAELEDKLITSIRLNNKDAFVENLAGIIELLKEYPYSDAVSIMFQIISSCIKVINQLIREDSQKFFINFDEFSSIFSEMQTLDQAKHWLIDTFEEYQKTVEQIVQLKSDRHFKVVEKAQDYIKENYVDLNLSTESVAETVGYMSYYFSKVFKEISGLTVNNYIRQIRINKAKEYLSQPDIKINDIPGMTGFTTVSHFYSVFKKDVGLSPAAYREYVLDHK